MSAYLLILRRDQSRELGLPMEEMFTRFKQFTESLHEKGILRAFERLKPASEGTTARQRDGSLAIEGPYDGAPEDVIGFYLIEAADPADGQLNWWKGDGREYGRKIIGKRPLDFPDEAQCQVQLLVVLPPEIHTFHYVDQSIADRFGRKNGDEEARHWLSFLR